VLPVLAQAARRALDQAQVDQLDKGLAKGADVAEVAAGHHDPVGHLPAQRLQDAIHDRLLPLQTEGIDAVDKIDAELRSDLLHAQHGIVEVAGNLHRQRSVVQRLRQLAVGDLARADEDDGPHQPGGRAEDGEAGAGVARRGARRPAGADDAGVGERRRHAVVLEAARRVHPLVLEEQLPGVETRIGRDRVGPLAERLPLADRHDSVVGCERE